MTYAPLSPALRTAGRAVLRFGLLLAVALLPFLLVTVALSASARAPDCNVTSPTVSPADPACFRSPAQPVERRTEDAEMTEAGRHGATFEAAGLPSETYLWRLDADDTVEAGRLTLLR